MVLVFFGRIKSYFHTTLVRIRPFLTEYDLVLVLVLKDKIDKKSQLEYESATMSASVSTKQKNMVLVPGFD